MSSVLLQLPGAVPWAETDEHTGAPSPDTAIARHYGDPLGEQRAALRGAVLLDGSHREVVVVTGPDRLSWLHSLTSQDFLALADVSAPTATRALVLSPQGHVEHAVDVVVTPDAVHLVCEPGRAAALQAYLEQMRFWSQVEITTSDLGVLTVAGRDAAAVAVPDGAVAAALPWLVAPGDAVALLLPADRIGPAAAELTAAGVRPAGSWAADALRIPSREPRLGVDTDERTIPNETSWLRSAVHLSKGCYRGQETVARVDNLGRPPRRLVVLNLDGSADRLPATGDAVTAADSGRALGRVGTVAHHHELGPIALAMVKRSVTTEQPLLAGGVDALVDPDGWADHADSTGEQPPRSVVDRRALPDLRRR